jgi:hypothetical protein
MSALDVIKFVVELQIPYQDEEFHICVLRAVET